MIKVSATNLRKNLFEYLDKAAGGETIVIQRNNQEAASEDFIKFFDLARMKAWI